MTELNSRKCMKLSKVETYSRYLEIVEKYGRKGCVINDFLQREVETLISAGKLFESCYKENAFLFIQKDTCLRVYYYLNDLNETVAFDGDDFVVEILYRGDSFYPSDIVAYLEKCGFQTNLVRDLYCLRYKELNHEILGIDLSDIDIHFADTIKEAKMCITLFNESFDSYSGNYINELDLPALIENKNLYVATQNGMFMGSLHVSKGGNNLYWMDHLAVSKEARGKHVATKLFMRYISDVHENDGTRYQLWTQRQNEIAVNMYKKLGFKYLGKSTLSMIRTK